MFKALIISMRSRQWTKNLFIFTGVLFSGNLFNLPLLLTTVLAFILFCLLSGSAYLINYWDKIFRYS